MKRLVAGGGGEVGEGGGGGGEGRGVGRSGDEPREARRIDLEGCWQVTVRT